jgi:hypothetical protein
MAAPPLDAGAVKATESCPLPAVIAEILGAPGTLAGIEVVVIFRFLIVPVVLQVLAPRAWVINMNRPSE